MAVPELFDARPGDPERCGEHPAHAFIAMLALIQVANGGIDIEPAHTVRGETLSRIGSTWEQQDAKAMVEAAC